MFQCLEAPSVSSTQPSAGGRTLFANTHHIYQDLFRGRTGITPFAREIDTHYWKVFTPMNKSFGGDELRHPISTINPLTEHTILRWHERW